MAGIDRGRDMLFLELVLTPKAFQRFTDMVQPSDVHALADRLDRWMFGKKGSLARSIKAQNRDPESWKPLSEPYRRWKVRRKKDKRPLDEPPPNVVISDKIWIRTGKIKEFTETANDGTFKTVRVFWQNMFYSGRPFCEWFVKNIPYWKYPDEQRKLFFWTPDDVEKCQGIFAQWCKGVVSRALGAQGQAAKAGAAK